MLILLTRYVVTKKMPFRLQCKSMFLTYPQCSTAKDVVLARLKDKFKENLEWAVIVQEQHASGDLHLHACVMLKRRVDWTNPNCLDNIGGKHGNYQRTRSIMNALTYLTKTDQEPLVHGSMDLEATLKKANGKSAYLAHRILEGAELCDLREEEPGFFLMHQRNVENFVTALSRDRLRKRKRSLNSLTLKDGGMGAQLVLDWLQLNVLQTRAFKQKQLFITSAPNMGKTTMMMELGKHVNIFWAPMFEDFEDDWEDGVYDLVVFDEFKGQRKITWMNKYVEGGPMYGRKKGSQYFKAENVPVVVLSNFCLEQCYSRVCEDPEKGETALAPFRARFIFVTLREFSSIKFN